MPPRTTNRIYSSSKQRTDMYHSSNTRRLLVAAVVCLCSLVGFAAVLPDTIVAFPGAEGFGKYTSGGRGGKVVYVTTLEDDANGEIEGSLGAPISDGT